MSDDSNSDIRGTSTEDRVEGLPGWLIGIAVTLVIGYAVFVVLLWRLGLFDVPAKGPDARVFAAVFALLGALFGAVLTFAAALLKHTIDTRTLALSRQTERRLRLEKEQEESRLRLDTSIRAIALLSNEDGSESSTSKQAGALFALSSLGQTELALALLPEVWRTQADFSRTAAAWVIDRGLQSPSKTVQWTAAIAWADDADKMLTPDGGMTYPASLTRLDWPTDVSNLARGQLLGGVLKALRLRPRLEWRESALFFMIALLNEARIKEGSLTHRADAVQILSFLLEELPDLGAVSLETGSLDLAIVRIEVARLKEELAGSSSVDTDVALQDLRERWARGAGPEERRRRRRQLAPWLR